MGFLIEYSIKAVIDNDWAMVVMIHVPNQSEGDRSWYSKLELLNYGRVDTLRKIEK